jgi:spermidine synthase
VQRPRRAKATRHPAARRSGTTEAAIAPDVLVASFLTGAIVLVVEIVGARVVGPYYGASVYVWSALIGVTLGSLTIGYVVGGWAADRWPPLGAFALETIGGALHLLLVPSLREPVLVATTALGLEMGSLVSAAVFFGPPLVLLGMTGPSAIRLVTSDVTVLGRGVGAVYGVSTLGSMIGAVLTGFLLLPSFAVTTLLNACAAFLLAIGGIGLVLARAPLGGGAALVLAGLAAVGTVRGPSLPRNVLYVGNSFHGELKVIDTPVHRVLLIDGVDNGFVDRASMEPRAPYIASFDYLPAARPEARRALCIGLGAGGVPRAFHRRGIATDVVEIDPEIARLAREWLGFPADIPVIVEDGRTYVERTTERYDFVVLDAFHAETHPVHLFTREFFTRVDGVLSAGGILAINMAGIPDGEGSAAWRSVHRTLAERFAHVRVFATPTPPNASTRVTNLFILASQAPLPTPAGDPTLAMLATTEISVPRDEGAVVLTDDYNPVDDLHRAALVGWREAVIRNARALLLVQ